MMKFILMMLFMNLMIKYNNMLMFYYNLSYLLSFMMIFMYMYSYNGMLWFNYSFNMSCNNYSYMLLMLSIWIISLMMMSLGKFEEMKLMIFINIMMLMMMFFLMVDLMMFYLLFEISLIPTFFLIIYWGSNLERISAGYYMLIYMLLISFPLLVYIFDMNNYMMSFKFMIMVKFLENYMVSFWSFMVIFLPFYIKMPMFMFHIWLPKAHVEAPIYGSMILAGILLKMGSYGLIRLLELFTKFSIKYNYLMISIGMVGSILVSVVCLSQIDMKSLVAYSSVVHMNLMLCSLMTMFKLGVLSSYIMMISHGLCSSGMFYMVGLFYCHSKSRLLLLNKGLLNNLFMLSKWWFMFCIINFSFPFSLSFISEIMMLMVIYNWDLILMIYMMMVCFFSSAYSLYMFSYIYHGKNKYIEEKNFFCKLKEFLVMFLHLIPLVMLMFNVNMFI